MAVSAVGKPVLDLEQELLSSRGARLPIAVGRNSTKSAAGPPGGVGSDSAHIGESFPQKDFLNGSIATISGLQCNHITK